MHPDAQIRELLEEIGPAGRRLVAHVAGCDVCRLRLLSAVDDDIELGEVEAKGLLARLEEALGRAAREDRERESRAEESVLELAGLPAGAALAAIADGKAPRNPALAARLLPDEVAAGGDPEAIEERAHLVLALGAALDGEGGGEGSAESTGRGWSAVGEVARLRGDLGWAELAFRAAAEALEPTELSHGDRALFGRLLARLRVDQGRVDEALGLLERASGLYSGPGLYSKKGEVLADKGRLLLEELDFEAAALSLRAAANLIDPKENLWAAVRARQGLALCVAERGEVEGAQGEWLKGTGWRPIRQPWSAIDRLRLTVMSAEIAERRGESERAVELLRPAIEGLVGEGELYDAAVATAFLLRLLSEVGEASAQAEGLRELLAPLARDEFPWAVLGYLLDRAAGGEGSYAAQVEASEIFRVGAEYLDRARHNPKLAYHPRWRPKAVLSWESLEEEHQSQARRLALVGSEILGTEAATEMRVAWVYEAYTEIRIVFLGHGKGRGGH